MVGSNGTIGSSIDSMMEHTLDVLVAGSSSDVCKQFVYNYTAEKDISK